MEPLHVRLDTEIDTDLVSKIVDNSIVACWVGEKQDSNPHVHLAIQTDVPLQTLRNWIRSAGLKGNKSYSISKVRNWRNLLAYLHKDNQPCYKELSIEEINLAVEDAKTFQEEKKAGKAPPVLEKILATINPYYLKAPQCFMKEIKLAIIDHYVSQGKLVRKHMLQAIFDTIMCRSDPQWGLNLFS